jgi:hypothetical protein
MTFHPPFRALDRTSQVQDITLVVVVVGAGGADDV